MPNFLGVVVQILFFFIATFLSRFVSSLKVLHSIFAIVKKQNKKTGG